MTHELRHIIECLSAGQCVPSLQKKAAEMMRVAGPAVQALAKLPDLALIKWGNTDHDVYDLICAAKETHRRAADLFSYVDEETQS